VKLKWSTQAEGEVDEADVDILPDTGFHVIKSGKAKKKIKADSNQRAQLEVSPAPEEGPARAKRKEQLPKTCPPAVPAKPDKTSKQICVVDAVWRVLLQGRKSADSHLSRLQKSCDCSVTVDRTEPKIRVVGTSQQVECAEASLRRLGDLCETAKVKLPSHVKWPQAIATRAEGSGSGVKVELRREGGGFTAHVEGLSAEVRRAVEMINAEAQKAALPSGEGHWIEVADSVWKLLLQGSGSAGSSLSHLEEECGCSVTVDCTSPWIMVNGTELQTEKAQTLLWQLLDTCDSSNAQAAHAKSTCDSSNAGPSGQAKAPRNRRRGNRSGHVDTHEEQAKPTVVPNIVVARRLASPDSSTPSEEAPKLPRYGRGDSSSSTTPNSVREQWPGSPSTGGSDFASDYTGNGGAMSPDAMPFIVDSTGQNNPYYFAQMGMNGSAYYGAENSAGWYSGQQWPNTPGELAGRQLLNAANGGSQRQAGSALADKGGKSMAARLAEEFPSARIIIGAPDSQEAPAPPPPPLPQKPEVQANGDGLECKMRKLQDLLAQGRGSGQR